MHNPIQRLEHSLPRSYTCPALTNVVDEYDDDDGVDDDDFDDYHHDQALNTCEYLSFQG